MSILERVTELIRANLNDLIDRAEDPEKMIKQYILDMESELKQLKGQVAVTVADQHLLERKHQEHLETADQWMRKAELAVSKQDDDLARSALERHIQYAKLAGDYERQMKEHREEVEHLKLALSRLEQKLSEARSTGELLLSEHRRSRALGKAAAARNGVEERLDMVALKQLQDKVMHSASVSRAKLEMETESTEEKLERMEQEDRIESMLAAIKSGRKTE